MTEYNETKLRKQLLKMYRKFLKDPKNEENQGELLGFDRKYATLGYVNEHLKSMPIPEYICLAVGNVSALIQYNLGTYENEELIQDAKMRLMELEAVENSGRKNSKMISMFEEFNKTLKKKLIALYEDFIENPEDKLLKENAARITQRYANSGDLNLGKVLNFALGKVYGLELETLSKEEAKEILDKLKKSE